jgi:hypothetical protein
MSGQLPLPLALTLTFGDRVLDQFEGDCTFNRFENLSCLNRGGHQSEFSQLHRLVRLRLVVLSVVYQFQL